MNDENVENLLRVGSAGDRVPSASGSRGGSANGQRFSAPQNSARDPDPSIIIPNSGSNKIYQVTKPASNVFIDTGTDISQFRIGTILKDSLELKNYPKKVNSLDDINSKKKKVKVRNSSEISGRFGDRNEALSRR